MGTRYKRDIPISQPVYQNIDQQDVRNNFLTEIHDGYQNETGHIFKRPGLEEWLDLGIDYPIDALYWWASNSKLLAICNGILYDINYTTKVATALTGDKPTALNNITIAEAADGNALIIADGGKMIRWDGGASASYISDADAPTTVSHVIIFDRYLIANKVDTGSFYWSDVNDEESWDALSKADAEGATDNILAILKLGNEIVLIGSRTTEFFYDDGSTPFVAKKIVIESGTSAAYSCINVGSTIYFLDNDRNFVRLAGKAAPEVLSYAVRKRLNELSTVSDCIASHMDVGNGHFIQLYFPTDDITLVYDYGLDKWYDWNKWDITGPDYDAFRGKNHEYIETSNLHLCGDRTATGKIFKLNPDYYTDDGDIIRTMIQSGHNNWGTGNRKKTHELRLYFQRGVGNSDEEEPVCQIRWRDNINGSWTNWLQLELGKADDKRDMVSIHRCGIYETRQYQITMTDPNKFIFLKMEEIFEVLRR